MKTDQTPKSTDESKAVAEVAAESPTESPIVSPIVSPIDSPTESPTGSPTESPTESPTDAADSPTDAAAESEKALTCEEQILQFLESGEKPTDAIRAHTTMGRSYVAKRLAMLVEAEKIVRVRRGWYRLSNGSLARIDQQNTETINRLLNLYDTVIDKCAAVIEHRDSANAEITDLLMYCKALALTVDKLMHRWSLVHRGYDTNTRQAQEDAKAKARKTEAAALAQLPPEERTVVVARYHDDMYNMWERLPPTAAEKAAAEKEGGSADEGP